MKKTKYQKFKEYWMYYLHLEKMLIDTFDYVALSKENYGTFSNQYASIFQLTGAEIDAFFKFFFEDNVREEEKKQEEKEKGKNDLCEESAPIKKPMFDIKDYTKWLIEKKAKSINCPIKIYGFDETFKPFENLDITNHPNFQGKKIKEKLLWWRDFDTIKHHRQEYPEVANLKNCLTILAALFVLENEKIFEIGKENQDAVKIPTPPSKLFYLVDQWSDQVYLDNLIGTIS